MRFKNRREEFLAKQAEKAAREKNQAAFAEYMDRSRSCKQPILHADHKMPRTRRELLECGLIGSIASIALPNLMGVASSKLLGAELECSSGEAGGEGVRTPGYVELQLSGGWSAAHNVFVSKAGDGGFDPINAAGYQTLGLGTNHTPNSNALQPVDNLGALMHRATGFYQGLSSVMTAANLQKVRVAFMANESQDDNSRNLLDVSDLAAKIHGGGALTQLIDGGTAHTKAFEDLTLSRAAVEDEEGLGAIVDPGLVAQLLASANNPNSGLKNAVKTAEATYRLSQNKVDAMAERLVSKQIKDHVACGYKGASELIEKYTREEIVPSSDPIITDTPFGGLTYAQIGADEDQQKAAIIGKVLADGLAATARFRMGGYDYHGDSVQQQQVKDNAAGQAVGIMLEIAARKGQPLFIAVTSNGSVSYNGNGAERTAPRSDNGQRGAILMIAIDVDAAPVMKRHYVGTFQDGGAVDTNSSITAAAGPAGALAVAYNYAAFAGKLGEFSRITSANPDAAVVAAALNEKEHLAFEPKG